MNTRQGVGQVLVKLFSENEGAIEAHRFSRCGRPGRAPSGCPRGRGPATDAAIVTGKGGEIATRKSRETTLSTERLRARVGVPPGEESTRAQRVRSPRATARILDFPEVRANNPVSGLDEGGGVTDERPIGVFDSGVGGLTVVRALRDALPRESIVYLGDTARLPYGTKSPGTVSRYAHQAVEHLARYGVKLVVVACNTASALALEEVRRTVDPLPVVGVVQPGARAAARASASGRITVIATESTARNGAYEREILAARPDAQVVSQACSLFVALAEEGWTHGPIAESVALAYLQPLVTDHRADCLVLGCTHFPVLADAIGKAVGPEVRIVDSAATTAAVVREELSARDLARVHGEGGLRLLATDSPERFRRVAERFLPAELLPKDGVALVDLR
jgi:glutamate racemase